MYEYRCEESHYFTRFLPMAFYKQPQKCGCGKPAEKLLSAPAIHTDYPGYRCPITDVWIEGKRAHQENLARHGCRVYEPGETEDYKRRVAADEVKLDSSIESTVDQFIASRSADDVARLCNETAAGANCAIDRKTFRG